MNNVVRVAYEALAAVLGGAQTLATSSFDEALGLPSDEAVHLSLRTQQILAFETGVRSTVDPLGGSFHVEALTDELERRVTDYCDEIERRGGGIGVLDSGWLEQDLTRATYDLSREIDDGTRPVVGVNLFADDGGSPTAVRPQPMRGDAESEQVERLRRVRATRDPRSVEAALGALRDGAKVGANSVPLVLDAIRAYATVGEICGALKEVHGQEGARSWRTF
jgi:methylmalonyl-CoA mutase N-terminal domain/subunit